MARFFTDGTESITINTNSTIPPNWFIALDPAATSPPVLTWEFNETVVSNDPAPTSPIARLSDKIRAWTYCARAVL